MLQRLSPWLAAGLTTGLVILLGIWLMTILYFNTFVLGYQSTVDPKLVSAVIDVSANNPEVQTALKNHFFQYLKSPEGKSAMIELLKSPEVATAMSENYQSPEMRAAIIKMMELPEFRSAMLQSVQDLPEMRFLKVLSAAVVLDPNPSGQQAPPPAR